MWASPYSSSSEWVRVKLRAFTFQTNPSYCVQTGFPHLIVQSDVVKAGHKLPLIHLCQFIEEKVSWISLKFRNVMLSQVLHKTWGKAKNRTVNDGLLNSISFVKLLHKACCVITANQSGSQEWKCAKWGTWYHLLLHVNQYSWLFWCQGSVVLLSAIHSVN